MKKSTLLMLAILIAGALIARSNEKKLVSDKTYIKIFSTTPAEDIAGNNYQAVGTLDTESGAVVYSVPMQGFEFEKSLMQTHFNQPKFLDTKAYPKAKLVGVITNIQEIDFTTDGTYQALVSGDLTIKDATHKISEKGTVTVKGGKISIESILIVRLSDYGIAFEKGKPSTNIADEIEVTLISEFEQ